MLRILAIFALSCCTHQATPLYNTEAKVARTVKIHVACVKGGGHGSGVIMSPRVVATAAHVITCQQYPGVITVSHGPTTIRAYIAVASVAMDLALLQLGDNTEFERIEFGPAPDPGAIVCMHPARKKRERICGMVLERKESFSSDLVLRLPVRRGDSGSGLYDSDGRLVGIVTALWENGDGPTSIGFATSIEGRLTVKE